MFSGTSGGPPSILNSGVLFQDKVSKVLGATDGSKLSLPVDTQNQTGTSHRRPTLDRMSPLRREFLQDSFSDSLCTYDELTSHGSVSVPQVDGTFHLVPAHQVTMTEWLRILNREGLMQSGSVEAAEVAITSIQVNGAEAWGVAARRLVVVFRAFTADRERPHISEATYVWRYVLEKQLTDLLDRLVRLFLPNRFDQAGLQSGIHAQMVKMRTDIRPFQVDYVNPLGQGMVSRGIKTENIFTEFVDFISKKRTVCQTPADTRGASIGPSQRLASRRLDFLAQVRQFFNKPSRNAVAAQRGPHVSRSRMQRDTQVQDALLLAAYEWPLRLLIAATDEYPSFAAFKHQLASIPGRHGVPFGNARGEVAPWVHHGSKRALPQDHDRQPKREEQPPRKRPEMDAPRQVKVDFPLLHQFFFCLAFNGNCLRSGCPFNHDPSVLPAGHFRSAEIKRRRTGPSGVVWLLHAPGASSMRFETR